MSSLPDALLRDIPEEIETERLRLVATRAGSGSQVNEAVRESHAELREWMPWAKAVQSLDESERHCREMQAKWFAREVLDFCFLRKAGGAFVGKGGLHTIEWEVPKFEIGYWVRTSCARQGIATEATRALAQFAFATLGAKRLEITSDARNAASRRVAEKSDFLLECIRRQSRRDVHGNLADSCLYARIC